MNETEMEKLKARLKNLENRNYQKPYAHRDTKGLSTVGYGHLMTNRPEDRKLFSTLFGTDVSYDDLLEGHSPLPKAHADKLFEHDFAVKHQDAQRQFPQTWKNFSGNLQSALVDANFRGDLMGSPKAKDLLRMGAYKRASEEFLNNEDYRRSMRRGTGVAPRMKAIATAMRQEGLPRAGTAKPKKRRITKTAVAKKTQRDTSLIESILNKMLGRYINLPDA